MKTGIANGIYTGVNDGIEQGAYTGVDIGLANGNYNENILSNAIVRSGLVLHLDAAQNLSYPQSGTTWRDLTTNNNNGTLTNGPTFNSLNKGSIVFDGVNDYVNCGNPTSLDFNGQKNITVSSWIYPTAATNADANIITKPFQWYANFHSDRKIRVGFYTSTVVFRLFYSNLTISLNRWSNITWTYNGANIILYINSIVDVSVSETSNIAYGSAVNCNVLMGAEALFCGSPQTRYFNGRISQTLIYNRALTASEVLQNYIATKSRFDL